MYTKVKKLIISDVETVIVEQSIDKNVYVEAPKSIKVKQDSETLMIKGDGLNAGGITVVGDLVKGYSFNRNTITNSVVAIGGSKISGVDIHDHDESFFWSILRNLFGWGSKTTVRSRVVVGNGSTVTETITRNGKTTVKVNGKLLSEEELKEFEAERKPTVIKIPDGLDVTFKNCSDIVFESDFSFGNLALEIVGHGELRAKKLSADSAIITSSDHSTSIIGSLDVPILKVNCLGMSKLTIGSVDATEATVTSSNHSECKVNSFHVSELIANCSNMSKFIVDNGKTKRSTVTTSNHSNCKISCFTASELVTNSSNMSEFRIKKGEVDRVTLTASNHSTVKVEGKLQHVVATTSDMATCRFSKPSESPLISSSNHSTCKVI